MRGLTIVVAEADATRLRSALGLALSHAALGGTVRLFADTAAVGLFAPGHHEQDEERWTAIGTPTVPALIGEALDAGVAITLCQAGLALACLEAPALDPRLSYGGLVALLAALAAQDRLVVV